MSQYTPEELAAISRYQKIFPTLSAEIQNDTYARISELLEEGAQQEHLRRMGNEYCERLFQSNAEAGRFLMKNDARDDELRACETGRPGLCTFACNDSGKCGGLLWMMPDADHFFSV
jgi:hypothetical protein